jgi:hypothetical protein
MAVDPVTGVANTGQTDAAIPTTQDTALFASQLAAAQQDAPTNTGAQYLTQLADKFDTVYVDKPMTTATVRDGTTAQAKEMYDWVQGQSDDFKSWITQRDNSSAKENVVTMYEYISKVQQAGVLDGNKLSNVYTQAAVLRSEFTGLDNIMNALEAQKLDTSNPGAFINAVNAQLTAAGDNLQNVLGDDSKGKVGALTLLSNAMKDAMAGGWSSDAVAIEALKGMGLNPIVTPGQGSTALTQAIGDKVNAYANRMANVANSAADKFPNIVSSYKNSQTLAMANMALNIVGGLTSVGTGLSKLALAGGLAKVAEGDAKAVTEFAGFTKLGGDLVKSALSDSASISRLSLPSTKGYTGSNLDSSMSKWIQSIATYWGNDAIGGTKIAGEATITQPGEVYTPPEARAADANYSQYYWVRSDEAYPVPPEAMGFNTVWTLYGIPRTS